MLRRWAATALVATAAALPFELRATLPLGPLRLSSVEFFMYATLALWGASRLLDPAARRRCLDVRRWPRALGAAAALALVLLLAAARAPQFRGAAFKFALRSLSGILLAFAAADLLRAPDTRRRALVALAVGMLVAAAAVTEETTSAAVARWLRPFHDQTFQTLGQIRGSGPFQYPNIAAMALEAAVPIVLALSPRLFPAAFLIVWAVVATGSRAGMATAVLAMLAIALVWMRDPARRRAGWMLAGALFVLVPLIVATNPVLSARLRPWHQDRWYRAQITAAGGAADRLPARLAPSQRASELLALTNAGTLAWRHAPPSPIALSYHWVDADTGRVVVRDGLRTALPADVPAGASVTVRASVWAPARAGRYLLWWDLLQEDVVWFSPDRDGGRREPVLVGEVAPAAAPSPGAGRLEDRTVDRAQLWRAAWVMFRAHPVLGVGPDNFRRTYGRVLGLAAPDDRLHANSLYLETLADLGLAGAAAWAALLLALAAAAGRAWRRPLGAGVAIALGTFLLHGALDYFFEFTPTAAIFWLLVGALIALDSPASQAIEEAA